MSIAPARKANRQRLRNCGAKFHDEFVGLPREKRRVMLLADFKSNLETRDTCRFDAAHSAVDLNTQTLV
jgi:hypothetical protein